MNAKLLLAAVGCLIIQGCVSGPKYTPMNTHKYNLVKKVKIYNLVVQDEVRPSVEVSNASVFLLGGLVGAVIDSSINKGRSFTAQDVIEPLYNATESLDYRELLANSINSSLRNEFSIQEMKQRAETVVMSNKEHNKKILELESGEGLLYMSSFYALVENSTRLVTTTMAFLHIGEKDEKGSVVAKKYGKPDYFNVINYESKPVGKGGIGSITLWSENKGKLFSDSIKESVNITAEALVYDMQPILDEKCNDHAKIEFSNNIGTFNLKGKIIKQNSSRTLMRANSGALYSGTGKTLSVKKNIPKTCGK